MDKTTIPHFQTGEVVTCINQDPLTGNEIGPPVEREKDYTIQEVLKCTKCGSEHLDIGIKSTVNSIECHECATNLPRAEPGQIWWCHPTRFIHAEII